MEPAQDRDEQAGDHRLEAAVKRCAIEDAGDPRGPEQHREGQHAPRERPPHGGYYRCVVVVVEGVARSLDPQLDMWKVAEPVVREWIERHLGAPGMIEGATDGVREVGKFFGEVPSLLSRGASLGRAAVGAFDVDGLASGDWHARGKRISADSIRRRCMRSTIAG